jgi:hypothetical protein
LLVQEEQEPGGNLVPDYRSWVLPQEVLVLLRFFHLNISTIVGVVAALKRADRRVSDLKHGEGEFKNIGSITIHPRDGICANPLLRA